MKSNNKPEIKDSQSGYLSLPFDQNQFSDFVRSLLGTPQTINKQIEGIFEIHMKDLQNFHDLINQRIVQQNDAKLIQLKSEIYFSDESSVIMSSYEELTTYNEVKPVLSEAVRMTWSYLIQFKDKSVPEKQEVEIMIIAVPQKNVIEIDGIPTISSNSGQFRISIRHTARSWGADMESLITKQMDSIIITTSFWKYHLNRHSFFIGLSAGLLFLLSSLTSAYISIDNIYRKEIVDTLNVTQKTNDINEKINFLINNTVKYSQNILATKLQIFVIISFMIAIFLGIWVGGLAKDKRKSHIILTRTSVKNLDTYNEKIKNKPKWFIVSILVSIITSILSNYLFAWLTEL